MTWREQKRKGIMLCYPFEERRLSKWEPPYLVQPKLDGERCRAICTGGQWVLLSSEENHILSVPHIVGELTNTFGQFLNIELDGELYSHGLSFEEIHSRVGRTTNLHDSFEDIEYHVFDLVIEEPQAVRLVRLKELPLPTPHVKIVRTEVCNSLKEIMDTYQAFLKNDYEGIVVRHFGAPYVRKRSTFVMKFKPKKSDYYRIIGIQEEVDKYGNPKDRLGAFVCTSDEGTTFSVGTGLTDEDRVKWWTDAVVGYWLKVEYQHTTPGRGVPRFPVFAQVCNEQLEPLNEIP